MSQPHITKWPNGLLCFNFFFLSKVYPTRTKSGPINEMLTFHKLARQVLSHDFTLTKQARIQLSLLFFSLFSILPAITPLNRDKALTRCGLDHTRCHEPENPPMHDYQSFHVIIHNSQYIDSGQNKQNKNLSKVWSKFHLNITHQF